MSFSFKAPADRQVLMAAALIGAGLGLGLGATYMAAGLSAATTSQAQARAVRAQADASVFAAAPPAETIADAPEATPRKPPIRRRELDCLTQAVYYEARGESPSGQAAVAQVVLNRVRHPAFPKTVCGVVYQGAQGRGCQFSFACNGAMRANRESAAWKRARRVAVRALAGAGMAQVGAATHFHTTGVAPNWGPQLLRVSQVGLHIFYRLTPHGTRPAKPPREEAPQVVLASFTPAPAPEAPRELQLSVALLESPPEAPVAAVQPESAAEAAARAPAKPADETPARP